MIRQYPIYLCEAASREKYSGINKSGNFFPQPPGFATFVIPADFLPMAAQNWMAEVNSLNDCVALNMKASVYEAEILICHSLMCLLAPPHYGSE